MENFSEMIKWGGWNKRGGDVKNLHCSGVSVKLHNNVSNIGKPASIYTLNVN